MKLPVSLLIIVLLATSSLCSADDQGKALKQVNRISAMAADLTGRRLVNQSLAEQYKVKHADLINERVMNNLNYGSLFILHELLQNGTPLSDITGRLKSGKTIIEAANDLKVDWKKIGDHAKSVNNRIEDNIYRFFLNGKPPADDVNDPYNNFADGVPADMNVSQQDIDEASEKYLFWKTRATAKQDGRINTTKEQAARQTLDPVRKGGPQADQVGNTSPTPR